MNLADFQEAFAFVLLRTNEDATLPESNLDLNVLGFKAKQFAMYRALILTDLQQILTNVYPASAKLMMPADFQRISDAFFIHYPPKSINPVVITEFFANFLEQLISSDPNILPKQHYLPDLATLDYGCYQAQHTVDADAINHRAFTDISPEILTTRRVHLHPACFWISSNYAIYDLWRHQQANPNTVIFEVERPQEVVIIRPKLQVEVHRADIGLVKMLDAIDAGETLNHSLMQGSLADPRFNAVGAMQFLIQNDLIVSLY